MKAQPSSSTRAADPESAYYALIEQGKVQFDPAQLEVLAHLQTLHEQLAEAVQPKGFFSSLRRKKTVAPASLYIWGNVGRGKSMLMDLFFSLAPPEKKRRVHFHRFMQDVHAGLHRLRQQTRTGERSGDPLMLLVEEISAGVQLLCFDELQATDVADASLLHRLFDALFETGVVMVATSNHPPASLYTGGVQRERFSKFIHLLEARMQVVALSSPRDYRTQAVKSLQKVYHSPLGRDADLFITHTLDTLAPEIRPEKRSISVHGRTIPLTFYGDAIASASFRELCEIPLGPADYLAIAAGCEMLVLTGIPALSPEKRNEAKRFVTMVDALYEQKTTLLCTAAAPPEELYPAGDGSFEFQRTVSRLREMQSQNYLEKG